jgi:hypothetical protein
MYGVDTRIFICSYTHICPYVYEGIEGYRRSVGSNEKKKKEFWRVQDFVKTE